MENFTFIGTHINTHKEQSLVFGLSKVNSETILRNSRKEMSWNLENRSG